MKKKNSSNRFIQFTIHGAKGLKVGGVEDTYEKIFYFVLLALHPESQFLVLLHYIIKTITKSVKVHNDRIFGSIIKAT